MPGAKRLLRIEDVALKDVKTRDDFLCVVPGQNSESVVPGSAAIFDSLAGRIDTAIVETTTALEIEIWRSINSDNLVSLGPPKDDSNIKYLFLGTIHVDVGVKSLPRDLLDELSQSRYAKFDAVRGSGLVLIHNHGG